MMIYTKKGYSEGYTKAIEDFVEKLLPNAPRNWANEVDYRSCFLSAEKVKRIAEEMRGVE